MKMDESPEMVASYRRESKGSVLGSWRIQEEIVWLCKRITRYL